MCMYEVLFMWENKKKVRNVFLNFYNFLLLFEWLWLILMQLHNLQFHASTFGIHFQSTGIF